MLQSITTNPLFIRLTRNAKGPSLRDTLWIAGASVLLGALIGIGSGFVTSESIGIRLAVCGLLSFTLTIPTALWPSIIAIFAATRTGDDVLSKDYDMLKLTLITPQQIASGYVFAWLYRLRVLFAIAIGLSFMGLCQWLGISLSERLSTQSVIASFELFSAACNIALSAFVILRVTGLAILASAAGVTLSLLWRQRGPAAIVAAIVMIILQAIGYLVSYVLPFIAFSLYTTPADWDINLIAISAGYGVVSTIVVYSLAWGTMRLARRWA
ncbi:MAG: hypothetical protein JXB30_04120 [Anaerolineae bacterium]|nr:hypothetical protein [Anaerolineae bacterium]